MSFKYILILIYSIRAPSPIIYYDRDIPDSIRLGEVLNKNTAILNELQGSIQTGVTIDFFVYFKPEILDVVVKSYPFMTIRLKSEAGDKSKEMYKIFYLESPLLRVYAQRVNIQMECNPINSMLSIEVTLRGISKKLAEISSSSYKIETPGFSSFVDMSSLELALYTLADSKKTVTFSDLKIYASENAQTLNLTELNPHPISMLSRLQFWRKVENGDVMVFDALSSKSNIVQKADSVQTIPYFKGTALKAPLSKVIIPLNIEAETIYDYEASFWLSIGKSSVDQSVALNLLTSDFIGNLDNPYQIKTQFVPSGETEYSTKTGKQGFYVHMITQDKIDTPFLQIRGLQQTLVIHSNNWVYLKWTFKLDRLRGVYLMRISAIGSSAPDIEFGATRSSGYEISLPNNLFRFASIELNANCMIDSIRIRRGLFFNFWESSNELSSIEHGLKSCLIGFKLNFFQFVNGETTFTHLKKQECDICFGQDNNSKALLPKATLKFWDGERCADRCKLSQVKDFKTLRCYNPGELLVVAGADLALPSANDNIFLCGDGFIQLEYGEECEPSYSKETDVCNPSTCKLSKDFKGLIMYSNQFGRQMRDECSIDVCSKIINHNPQFGDSCLTHCDYALDEKRQIVKLSDLDGKQLTQDIYFGEVRECSSFKFNVDDNIFQWNDKTLNPGFQNCGRCTRKNGNKIESSDDLYRKDNLLKFCFERELSNNDKSIFPSINGIDIQSWIVFAPLIITIVNFGLAVFMGESLGMNYFTLFWDAMQLLYVWGYHLEAGSSARVLFNSYKIVRFESAYFQPIISRYLLRETVDRVKGIQLLSSWERMTMNIQQFSVYRNIYEKYFRNEKVCVFLYDAGGLIDILAICLILNIITYFVYYIYSIVLQQNDPLSRTVRVLKALRRFFGYRNYVRYFAINHSLLTFYSISHAFMFTTSAEEVLSTFSILNKAMGMSFLYITTLFIPILAFVESINIDCKDKNNSSDAGDLFGACKEKKKGILNFLNMIRRLLVVFMFVPVFEITSGSSIFTFLLVILQLLTILMLTESGYAWKSKYRITALIFNIFVLLISLIVIFDKLADNISSMAQISSTLSVLYYYKASREYVLVFFFFFVLLFYTAIGILLVFDGNFKKPEEPNKKKNIKKDANQDKIREIEQMLEIG